MVLIYTIYTCAPYRFSEIGPKHKDRSIRVHTMHLLRCPLTGSWQHLPSAAALLAPAPPLAVWSFVVLWGLQNH